MRKLLAIATLAGVLLFSVFVGIASADPTGNQGQPSQDCSAQTSAPGGGNSSVSTGSPFQATASSAAVYANGPGTGGPGTATMTGHITNQTAVSQYDVACFQVSH
jgi:hypothetical protein